MKRWIRMLFVVVGIMAVIGKLEAGDVPHLLHFQSSLYDDGGNFLPDGAVDVVFRLKDNAGTVLYDERQSIEVTAGQAAAIIGNGLNADDGAPTGGLPIEVFAPGDGRYLEIEVEGYPPSAPMEIVSVPYAMYAETAARVADGTVDAATIAAGSIALEHFAPETISQLAEALTGDNLLGDVVTKEALSTTYSAPSGATNIGVAKGLVYSAKGDLQGVLRDLDRAIDMRQAKITAEGATRAAADTALQSNITTEAAARSSGDSALQTNINNEANARAEADSAFASIFSDINNIPGVLSEGKIDSAITRDSELQSEVAALNARIDGANGDLDELESLPRVYSWGRVDYTDHRLLGGGNISSVSRSPGSNPLVPPYIVVTFSDPLPSANYAIAVTPLDSTLEFSLSNITQDGFRVNSPGGLGEFSFVAVH